MRMYIISQSDQTNDKAAHQALMDAEHQTKDKQEKIAEIKRLILEKTKVWAYYFDFATLHLFRFFQLVFFHRE